MGFSNLEEVSISEKRLIFDKYPQRGTDHLLLELPKNYLFFSLLCLKNLSKVLEKKDPLPSAIVVDLDLFSLKQITPELNELKYHPDFRGIPVIGIAKNESKFDPTQIVQAGLDDCFYGKVVWQNIEERVDFLARYKSNYYYKSSIELPLKYKIPLGKRAFDIVSASIGLLLLSPLLILVAILVKLESKGSIFYVSKRIGKGYQEFNFIKFRSMRVDADEQLEELSHLNTYDNNSTTDNTFFKIKNDPRVTRVGKFIRKTSIDELPQLINVLRGEMSIIGNRPLPLYEAEKMTKDNWANRFMAPAGLTGLWQVDKRGKDTLTTEERVALDVTYARGVSFLTDLKIMLRTVPAMWQRN